jgi:hypothetical protein
MQLAAVWQWVRARQRPLAYGVGSGFVAIWTLVRFFTQRSIFDLVSQQVVVQQWLHGTISPAHMGQTAYLPKMVLYAVADLLPGSPRLKLILITLAINLATFMLLGLVLERLLRMFRIRAGAAFYGALVLLGMIAGSVFWIGFANSRNLEVVGGVFWLYLGLRLLQTPTWQRRLGMLAFGSLLFFDDPLQAYMSALPLLLYAGILAVTRRGRALNAVTLLAVSGSAWVGAQVLFALSEHWLQVSFRDTGGVGAPAVSMDWLWHSATGSVHALIGLLAGAADGGKLRELVNLTVLAAGAAAFVYTAMRRLVPGRLLVLLGCVAVTDLLVYVASGQAVQGAATARYLIMLAPLIVVALAVVRWPGRLRQGVAGLALFAVAINAVVLGSTLLRHWDTTFPADRHLTSVQRYARSHPNVHSYASIDTAMPVLYFSASPAGSSLPVGCLAGKLVRTHFSMDTAFAANAAHPTATVAVILDGNDIANNPNLCTQGDIVAQFGQPLAVQHTDDGSSVLMYRQASIHLGN